MTVHKYGKVTPIQADILGLTGVVLSRFEMKASENQIKNTMVYSHHKLVKQTGEDFGYDIAAWHEFLSNSAEFRLSYRHPFAWSGVKERLDEVLSDELFRHRVERIQKSALRD